MHATSAHGRGGTGTGRRGRGWRLLDTGLRRAAENIALDRALLEAHAAGEAPHTLRFLRFRPCALIGYHQCPRQELHLDHCRREGIEVQRRITGGGAIYFDEGQLGWELYLSRRVLGTSDMEEIACRVCEAAAAGIRRLGVEAHFRPRNDIEVGGRKLSGTGGTFHGDSLLYQGTLLLDFDVERMLRVLRVPAEKLSDKAVQTARERVVSLRELLGEVPPLPVVQRHLAEAFAEAFGVELVPGGLSAAEERRYAAALAEIDSRDWVYRADAPPDAAPFLEGCHRAAGGLIRACVWLDEGQGVVKQVLLTGDFFVQPPRVIADLEAALKDVPLAELRGRTLEFLRVRRAALLMLTPEDFVAALEAALAARTETGRDG